MNPLAARTHRTFPPLRILGSALALVFAANVLPSGSLASEKEDVFYRLGVGMGLGFTEFQLSDKELAALQKGFASAIHGDDVTKPTQEEHKRIQVIRNERVAKVSNEFLAKAKKEKGAQVQPSGLIYFEIEAGSGASPVPSDEVDVHYHGTLVNGVVFDSSVERGEPAQFPLDRVIPCWTEGVGMMKVGGKSKLVCPPSIAYGDRGAPPTIPGGAVLTFEVELLEIKPPTKSLSEE